MSGDTPTEPEKKVRVEMGFTGPDQRGFAESMLGLMDVLAEVTGETYTATKLLRPDRDVSPGVAVSDEGYRFETTAKGVEVFAPDGTSLGVSDQRGAEAAAGAHFFDSPESLGAGERGET